MDSQRNFEISPLPIEREFHIQYLKQNLHTLSREQLEELLAESLEVIARLTHQMKQIMSVIQDAEGKTE